MISTAQLLALARMHMTVHACIAAGRDGRSLRVAFWLATRYPSNVFTARECTALAKWSREL